MIPHDFIISIRNSMLMQLVLVLAVPSCAVEVRQEFLRFWRSIHAPFLRKREAPKKGSFWEIDMTRFEP